ncbi:Glycosyltransferase family 92 protein [Caenorhabditis elegans]|uniref:Glycosyltransferase family 92 protein n=1 Tax=Caenorhabditis elegans TaxID=6239 RepID=Q9TZ82_CAEEL|nr:Glycosyltransferase family 92 protein [Caenorhabditis elegans]CCD64813.1 Glycosyltransferase family 92 protein [Caenorhabditis elegans]|eukprot:NP_494663.2 Uncharacterized protein CELE_F54D10.8 [Caenorhabditis elegans]
MKHFPRIAVFILLLLVVIGLLLYKDYVQKSYSRNLDGKCHVASWNQVHTDSEFQSYIDMFSRWLWRRLNLSVENNQNYTSTSILGAYVYPKLISISLTSQYLSQQKIYCRYYDCKRRELLGSAYESVVFPESVVHCPRRAGAEFVSVSSGFNSSTPEPVRLSFKAYDEPVHDLSVCVAPLYGNESKWLQIVDFVEHMKLEGATYFYFYVGTINDYDRKMLTEYVRTGDVEVTFLQDKFERPAYAWHLLMMQDCHLRSKYHSKWITFLDLDERISSGTEYNNLLEVIESQPRSVGELHVSVLNILKYEDTPEKFTSMEQLKEDMMFRKWTNTIDPTWNASKAIVRPEQIGIMFIHYAIAKQFGVNTVKLNASQAAVRHYRNTLHRMEAPDWHPTAPTKSPTVQRWPLKPEFVESLSNAIVAKVQHVYCKVPVNCTTIARYLWESRQYPNPCISMSPIF